MVTKVHQKVIQESADTDTAEATGEQLDRHFGGNTLGSATTCLTPSGGETWASAYGSLV